MILTITRRNFAAALGGAAALPSAAQGQQAMPVIGFLSPTAPDSDPDRLRGFRQGLKDAGYVEGENVAIIYRWADNQPNRLAILAADLVRRQVALIAAASVPSAQAAKAATQTIPVLFSVGDDPVRHNLIATIARPGGNVTGINFLSAELGAKRLELLRLLVPEAARVGLIAGAGGETSAETYVQEAQKAAGTIGLQMRVLRANTSSEIDATFAAFGRERPEILMVGAGPFYSSRRIQLVQLAAYHRLPAMYASRDFSEVGGLMSYGSDTADAFRQLGVYASRILKGAKAADLPVMQTSRFELIINHQTARMLGISVPPTLIATADEVIE
jgi:putative ABC transport system substrate-binding protein